MTRVKSVHSFWDGMLKETESKGRAENLWDTRIAKNCGGYYKGSIGVSLKVDLVQMIANVYFTIKDITAALTRTVRRL